MGRIQEIRAKFDKESISVYQAYNQLIAFPAIQNNRFEKPFSFHRMTWIKPSYLWLMERSNWGLKSNQEYVLEIRIKRDCWEKALSKGILTHPDKAIYENGVEWEKKFKSAQIHIQWDPERTFRGAKMNKRSIQVGISRFLIEEFNNDWITEIIDQTPLTKKIRGLMKSGKYKEAKRLLPKERVYDLSENIEKVIGLR